MIDIKALEKNEVNPETGIGFVDEYRSSIENRGGDGSVVDKLLSLNQKRKSLISEAEFSKAEQNKMGPEVARLKKAGEDASGLISEMGKFANEVKKKIKMPRRQPLKYKSCYKRCQINHITQSLLENQNKIISL